MTPAERARAKKLFAMLQSPYESEVLTATRKLKALLAEHGMTINGLVAGNVDWNAPPRDNQAGTQTQSSPPPPPSGPPPRPPDRHLDRAAHTWQPYKQGQQWTTADKVAIGLVVFFFIGLPALGGLLALYDKAPDRVGVPANKVSLYELPPEKPKPEQITLNDLVFSDVVLPNQTGDGGIKGVINNNSNLSLERITFEATLKDGDQLISTTTAQICSSYWYSQPRHFGCYGLCDRETLPVPPHQVRQLSTCDLGFGQIPQLKNPRIGYRVTQINENDVQMETLFARTPAEIAAEADVR